MLKILLLRTVVVILGTVNRVKDRFTEEGLAAVLKDRPQANRRRQGMATGPCACWDA